MEKKAQEILSTFIDSVNPGAGNFKIEVPLSGHYEAALKLNYIIGAISHYALLAEYLTPKEKENAFFNIAGLADVALSFVQLDALYALETAVDAINKPLKK